MIACRPDIPPEPHANRYHGPAHDKPCGRDPSRRGTLASDSFAPREPSRRRRFRRDRRQTRAEAGSSAAERLFPAAVTARALQRKAVPSQIRSRYGGTRRQDPLPMFTTRFSYLLSDGETTGLSGQEPSVRSESPASARRAGRMPRGAEGDPLAIVLPKRGDAGMKRFGSPGGRGSPAHGARAARAPTTGGSGRTKRRTARQDLRPSAGSSADARPAAGRRPRGGFGRQDHRLSAACGRHSGFGLATFSPACVTATNNRQGGRDIRRDRPQAYPAHES
jgi:hypothetical protein